MLRSAPTSRRWRRPKTGERLWAATRSLSSARSGRRCGPVPWPSWRTPGPPPQGADVLVCHPKTLAGPHLAEKLGIPCFLALPVPSLVPTQAFPAPGVATRDLGGFLNRLTYSLTQAAAFPFHSLINRWRRETLGLPSQPLFTDPFALAGKPLPVLYGFSPRIVPPPPDWPDHVHVTGYWFLDEPAWTPPPALVHFLEAGPPPVYVGFGSMAGQDPKQTTSVVLEALARTGQRGIVATGWGGLEARNSLPDVFVTDAVRP